MWLLMRHHAITLSENRSSAPQRPKKRLVVALVLKDDLLARPSHDDVVEPLLRKLPRPLGMSPPLDGVRGNILGKKI